MDMMTLDSSEQYFQGLAEAGVTFDDEGRIDGFQVGRAARIADWKLQQEEMEFEKFCRRLYQRNATKKHWDKLKREHPQQWRRELARRRQRYADNREAIESKRRAASLAAYKQSPVVNVCRECGARWCVIPGYKRKLHSSFCCTKCRNRWYNKGRVRQVAVSC